MAIFYPDREWELVGGPATCYRTFPRCCICHTSWAKRPCLSVAEIRQGDKILRICGNCLDDLRRELGKGER